MITHVHFCRIAIQGLWNRSTSKSIMFVGYQQWTRSLAGAKAFTRVHVFLISCIVEAQDDTPATNRGGGALSNCHKQQALRQLRTSNISTYLGESVEVLLSFNPGNHFPKSAGLAGGNFACKSCESMELNDAA